MLVINSNRKKFIRVLKSSWMSIIVFVGMGSNPGANNIAGSTGKANLKESEERRFSGSNALRFFFKYEAQGYYFWCLSFLI